ncbi:GLPGLI family protein [Chitinophaga dinghuensis]|uniref:GLPGLI family protein n=1 Tax=Chitinophaga dinghuensis TaxID=1539050 RepID=A0A327W1I6_9BACT|nr:hypothetical protein [Chitinophaga dinghuensis]RAJ81884.1 GLPGLI family protein [Chitinophaga dinghuensis]
MKKLIFLLAIAGVSATTAIGQDKSQGIITYEVTVNVHASMKPDQLKYKDLVPEKVVTKEVLSFNGNKSLLVRKDQEEVTSDEGAKIKIAANEGQVAVYTEGNQAWSLKDQDGKKTLVIQETKNSFENGTQTKEIFGFKCREVLFKSKNMGVLTLWVTDDLPLTAGPMGLFVDKGLVLCIESKKLSAVVTNVNYTPVNIQEVTKPADVQIVKK